MRMGRIGSEIAETHLELDGNRRLVAVDCEGILDYGEDSIVLAAKKGRVSIFGMGLEMNCLTPEGLVVTGIIQRLEFSEEQG